MSPKESSEDHAVDDEAADDEAPDNATASEDSTQTTGESSCRHVERALVDYSHVQYECVWLATFPTFLHKLQTVSTVSTTNTHLLRSACAPPQAIRSLICV